MQARRAGHLARDSGHSGSRRRPRRKGFLGHRRPWSEIATRPRERDGLSQSPPAFACRRAKLTWLRPRKVVIRPAHRIAVRTRVVINAAMSVDGKIAFPEGKPARLSNE